MVKQDKQEMLTIKHIPLNEDEWYGAVMLYKFVDKVTAQAISDIVDDLPEDIQFRMWRSSWSVLDRLAEGEKEGKDYSFNISPYYLDK